MRKPLLDSCPRSSASHFKYAVGLNAHIGQTTRLRIAQQSATGTLAAPIGVNEQHLDLAVRHGDEAGDLTSLIAYACTFCDLRQGIAHQRPEELNISFADEVVRCTDGCFPYLYDAWVIFRQDWKNA